MATEEELHFEDLQHIIEDLQKRVTQCEERLANIDKLFRDAHIA